MHVPKDTAFVFGDYNILVSGPEAGTSGEHRSHPQGEREIVLH